MSAVLKDILPKDSKSNMSNNGNDDEFSEEEIKNVLAAEANLAKQGLSTTDDYAIIRHQQKTSEEKLISKNPSKRVKAVSNSMKSSAVESASASIGLGMHKKNSIMAIFRQKNQSNIDFYDTLRAQSKSLADSASFAADFFHQAAQPKYPVFKNDLISHGFKVVSHGEKDHFCWKANNKFYHFAVDRPHGPQSEKGNTAGWFLRLQQKITESGLLEANSAETAAKK